MPLSNDVRLPKSVKPVYPDRCVRCGLPRPESFVRITTHSIGWWTVVLMHMGKSFRATVPACRPCARRIRWQRWSRLAIFLACMVPAIPLAMYFLGSYRGPFRKVLGVGATILLLSPYFLWEAFYAPVVNLTAYADEVDYEFTDREYAEEFAALNNGRVDDN